LKRVSVATTVATTALLVLGAHTACSGAGQSNESNRDGGLIDEPPDAMPPSGAFCALPGSVISTANGPRVVPGGPASTPDLSWLTLPQGFCAHYFGTVPDTRQLRFAPGGELFVASPSTPTTGGNVFDALAGIAILPDDDHDGFADTNITFLDSLPSVQGLLFANDAFYFQDGASIRSVPYRAGDRHPSAAPQLVTTVTAQQDSNHWPKVLDMAMDGTIYVTNGGSQVDSCESNWPIRGAVFALGAGGTPMMVSMGFRNPIALRCEKDHNVCLAAELALDFSGEKGGREKLVPVRPGDNWGYPCCATQDLPYEGVHYAGGGAPDCSSMTPESDSFLIGHTPFGLDFETGKWPAPWTGRVFVTLHGVNATWEGARVVAIALDPTTGLPLPASELHPGADKNTMLDFASGWDDGTHSHGRPAPVTFAPDGRMFLGDDNKGVVVWIAPVDLMQR
jgi:glucose/arabinose dehydrogenase